MERVPLTEEEKRLEWELRRVRAKRAKVQSTLESTPAPQASPAGMTTTQLADHVHELEQDVLTRKQHVLALRREAVKHLRECVGGSAQKNGSDAS